MNRDLRDSIVFTVQDLLTDPPFSHLDFVSCRNLLIYLQPDEQEKALLLFHFALREGGFLLLGTSETVGKLTDLFEPVSQTMRIFRRIGHGRPRSIAPGIFERSRSLWPRVTGPAEPKRPGFSEFTQRLLLDDHAPAAILVNRKFQGLYFFGPIDRYVRVVEGELSKDVPTMLRDGLAASFRAAVRQASRDHGTTAVSGAQTKRDGGSVMVSISARPVQHEGEELLLVSFVDELEPRTAGADVARRELARRTARPGTCATRAKSSRTRSAS